MFTRTKLMVVLLFTCIGLLLSHETVPAQKSVIPSSEYAESIVSDFPDILNVGSVLECGPYKIQLVGQPVITKSSNYIMADLDMKYLIVRVGITTTESEAKGWLIPASFTAQETYLGHAYGTYRLDYIMSAKAASGFNLPAFFTNITPGKMLSTVLVFEVFPDAENWIITFTPATFSDKTSSGSISFLLPKALRQ